MPPWICWPCATTRRVASLHHAFAMCDVHVGVGFVLVDGPGGAVHDEARSIDVGHHVGGLVLDRLERADRAAELDAVLGVLHADLEVHLREADEVGALDDRGLALHGLQRRGAAGDDALLRHADVLELHLRLLVGGDGLELRLRDAGRRRVDDDERDAVVALRAGLAADDREEVSDVGVAARTAWCR